MMVYSPEIYLRSLIDEEKALEDAVIKLREAKARFQIASHKYAALRDMVTSELRCSPYSKSFAWPPDLAKRRGGSGQFRFIGMAPGDAITTVLKEDGNPMQTTDIIKVLLLGGYGMDDNGTPVVHHRSINAALMKTSGIKRLDDDTYAFEEYAA